MVSSRLAVVLAAITILGTGAPAQAAGWAEAAAPNPAAATAISAPTPAADAPEPVPSVTQLAVDPAPSSGTTPTPTPTPSPAANPSDVVPDPSATLDTPVPLPGGRVATAPVDASGVQTVGVTWAQGHDGSNADLEVRTRTDGTWTPWVPVDPQDAPDPGSADARHAERAGTAPVWVGDVDAVQMSMASSAAAALPDLAVVLVGSDSPSTAATPDVNDVPVDRSTAAASRSSSRTAARVATARTSAATQPAASSPPPRIISRAEWGAPAPVCTPDVAQGLVGAAVHHTADVNTYSTVAEAEQLLRNDAAYHIQSRGWCDLGYNFVVDKWGNIYEGRAGSALQPIIGVHAGGFNTGTVGVAMLGTYDSAPSTATQAAVAQVIGWRLGAYRVDPRGTMSYATGVGENSRFQNQTVTLPRVFGHRDVAYTDCPGAGGYAALPAIRNMAWQAAQDMWAQPPSVLMRTFDNATVWLLAGGTRHAIGDLSTMSALSPLGAVTYAPQQYLDFWPVGQPTSRLFASPDGATNWFVDAGIRLAFRDCTQVTDFGLSCDRAVRLDADEVTKLYFGGAVYPRYVTTSGKTFWIAGGAKHEVADAQSLAQAGLSSSSETLLESGIGYLPYGDPIVRTGLRLHERGGTRAAVLQAGRTVVVPDALAQLPGMPTGTSVELDPASVARVPVDVTVGALDRAADGSLWFLTSSGRAKVQDPLAAADGLPTLPADLLDPVPVLAPVPTPFALKSATSGTISLVRAGRLRAVRGMGDLATAFAPASPTYLQAPAAVVALLPVGELWNAPGTMVKSASSATVYLLDGEDGKVPVATFAVTAELGTSRLATVSQALLDSLTTRTPVLRTMVRCASDSYIGLGGALWAIAPADVPQFPATYSVLEPATCAALPHSARPASRFLRTSDGTIDLVEGGLRRPISSYQRFLDLGGSTATMIQVSDFAASVIPLGARI